MVMSYYIDFIKNAYVYTLKDKEAFKQEYYSTAFKSNYSELKYCFYKVENDEKNIYGRVDYSYTIDGEVYDEFGESYTETHDFKCCIDFNIFGDTVYLSEVLGNEEEVWEFITDVSKIFGSRFLILGYKEALGYIEKGEVFKYTANKLNIF